MARPRRTGLDYFPLDVDFFGDRKIKTLKGKFGSDGITFYLYILCEIYKDAGYYLKCDDDFQYSASTDLNMGHEKIGLMLNFLLSRSLLDSKLFQSDKVLTSHGIQARYQEAIKERAKKTPVLVDEKFWLLSAKDTQSFVHCTDFDSFSRKNSSYSGKNTQLFPEECHKVKESKEKKSKGEESKEETGGALPGGGALFRLFEDCGFQITGRAAEQLIALSEEYSEDWVMEAIKRSADRGKKSLAYIRGILADWQVNGAIDTPQKQPKGRSVSFLDV